MKKGIVLYSSQNGSTRKVAARICDGLNTNGCQAIIVEINDKAPKRLDEFDFIGIGAPVHMFKPSQIVMDYIDSVQDFSDKQVFTFVTYGSEIGDGANWLRKRIAKRNSIDLGHFQCHGKNLFPGYTSRGYVFSPESPTEEEFRNAELFGKSVALNLMSNQPGTAVHFDRGTHFVSQFERFVTNRTFTKIIYNKFFSASKKRCNSCGKCAMVCPTKNIECKNTDTPKWGNNCILCCTCEINCPKGAISTPISWFIFSPFLWYNIIRTKAHKVPWAVSNRK